MFGPVLGTWPTMWKSEMFSLCANWITFIGCICQIIIFSTLGLFSGSLAYLHEGIEPKVVHRDIKSSNILIDDDFDAKVSDFGMAKLLGTGKSHITTRVMGTFG